MTGPDGLTRAIATLGTVSGDNRFTTGIKVDGVLGPIATGGPVFTATGVAGAPATLEAVSGDGQSGTVATLLAAPFVVEVTDRFGNAVSGATVDWTVAAGGGSILSSSTSGIDGRATANARLGTTAGSDNNRFFSSLDGLSVAPVSVTASAIAAAASTLTRIVVRHHLAGLTREELGLYLAHLLILGTLNAVASAGFLRRASPRLSQ